MPELDKRLVDRDELNIDQSFPQFNVKKKIYVKCSSRFDIKCRILDTASLTLICLARGRGGGGTN